MGDKTGIEWTDATWNPVTGCAKVSKGCKNCYAEREWPRMTRLVPSYAGRDFTDVRCHPERIDQPLRWKKPRKIFVNSMSDLFHPDVPFEFIDEVFAVMTFSPRHVFQILTKRADRMAEYMRRTPNTEALRRLAPKVRGLPMTENEEVRPWPRKNIWLGVSVEDQATADERIPLLLRIPAAVRWISAEPLLAPVSLDCWPIFGEDENPMLHWVVVGGESGLKARPMRPEWARALRDQCAAAGVPFLFKQWGEWFPTSIGQSGSQIGAWNGDEFMAGWGDIENPENNMLRAGKRAFGGRLLDGLQHDGYPESES